MTVERWTVARLAGVRPLVTVDTDGTGRVEVHVDDRALGAAGRRRAARRARPRRRRRRHGDGAGGTPTRPSSSSRSRTPRCGGPSATAPSRCRSSRSRSSDRTPSEPLDTWTRRIGFRTVELDTSADDHGTAFTFRINGRPIFVKGANWIPDDHLLTRITRERLAHRLDQAVDANLNLVRIWGGGIYESEDFYELCDERGLLVWQDFLLACAAYPEEQPLWDELEAEAREHVARLTPHPSLVLWNGGNENLWGFMDWGWQEDLQGRTWGFRYATELLKDVVAELDPTRPYSDGSPYSPGAALTEVHPNDPDHGTFHQWEVWNRVDYRVYGDDVPRFCSEFGFQGPPTWATLTRAVHAADGGPLTKDDPTFLLHQKADDGNGKLDRGMAPHLGVPEDFAGLALGRPAQPGARRPVRHRALPLLVAPHRGLDRLAAQRLLAGHLVGGDRRRRAPQAALVRAAGPPTRRACSPCSRARVARSSRSSTRPPSSGRASSACRASGSTAPSSPRRTSRSPSGPGRSASSPCRRTVATPADPAREVLVVRLGGLQTVHTWVEDVDLALDPDPLRASVTPVQDGYRVDVTATSLARDVTLLVDRLDPDARRRHRPRRHPGGHHRLVPRAHPRDVRPRRASPAPPCCAPPTTWCSPGSAHVTSPSRRPDRRSHRRYARVHDTWARRGGTGTCSTRPHARLRAVLHGAHRRHRGVPRRRGSLAAAARRPGPRRGDPHVPPLGRGQARRRGRGGQHRARGRAARRPGRDRHPDRGRRRPAPGPAVRQRVDRQRAGHARPR